MSEFEGKTVLITGCARARGMGRAIAVAFARAGADVVATDVASGGTRNENEEGLEEIRLGWKGLESLATEIEGLGRRILTLVGDVSRAPDVDRMVADALRRFGRLDVLVNNAAAPMAPTAGSSGRCRRRPGTLSWASISRASTS